MKVAQKSKIMTNSTNISADISMNGQDQCKVPVTNLVQGWHLLSRNPHQYCLSNGQTKEDLAVQHHQLHKQVQAVQASSSPSSVAVMHGPCLLTLKRGSRLSKPSD